MPWELLVRTWCGAAAVHQNGSLLGLLRLLSTLCILSGDLFLHAPVCVVGGHRGALLQRLALNRAQSAG